MKVIRVILSIIIVVLAGFMLITQNFRFMPYLMMVLGITVLITGVFELKKDKKAIWGYVNIIASLFAFFVSIQGFILNYAS